MSNFSTASEATATAIDSAGSAAKENSRVMEGLEAKTQLLKATFQDLANNVIDSQLVKSLLDLANALLSLLNTPVGTFITQVTLLTGVLWGGTGLIKAMKLLPAALAGVGTAAGSAATGITLFGTAINVSLPWLLAISAALAAIIAIAPKVSSWYKEITNDVDHANEKLEENKTKLENNKQRLEELSKIPSSNRTSDIEQEIYALEEENAELEKNIEYWKYKAGLGALEDVREGQYYGQAYKIATSNNEMVTGAFGNALDYYIESEEEAIEVLKELRLVAKDFNGTLEEAGYKLINFSKATLDSDRYFASAISQQKEFIQNTRSGIEATADEKKAADERNKALQDYYQVLLNAPYAELTSLEKENLQALENLGLEYDSLLETLYPVKESLQILSQGMVLNKQQVEVLAESYPQLVEALEQTADGYILNSDKLYDLAQAGNDTAREIVKAQIEATRQVITSTEQRIKAYQTEIEALSQLSGKKLFGDFGPKTAVSAALDTASTLFGFPSQEDLLNNIDQETENLNAAKEKLAQLLAEVKSWDAEEVGIVTGTGSSKKTDPIKEQSKAFKELNEIIEHTIFIREKQGASEQELISLYKDYQNQLNKEANWFREHGVDENSEYIKELQKQWWSAEGEISSIYDKIAETAEKAAEKAKKAWEKAMKAQVKSLEKRQNAYETLFSLVSDMAQDEIDALEKERTAVEEYWQGKIDALEQANEELEEQIEKEEALDALARARQGKVMVYKDGRFQYLQDIDKVSEAQVNLEKIEREEALNSEIKQLEKSRDEALEILDGKIEDWESFVAGWEEILDDYEREQDLALLQEQLNLSEQQLITQMENKNWETRLDNLSSYVKQYKDLMSQLSGLQSDLENENIKKNQNGELIPGAGSLAGTGYTAWAWIPDSGFVPVTVKGGKTQETGLPVGTIIYGDEKAWVITGGKGGSSGYTSKEYGPTPEDIWTPKKEASVSSGGGGGATSSSSGRYQGSSVSGGSSYNIGSQAGKDFINNAKPGATLTGGDGSSWTKNPDGSTTISRGNNTWVVPANANGTLSSIGGLSLVGEKGPELRVLNEGDGVIPSEVTKNLWAWGATSPASMMSNIVGGLQSMGQQIGITIQNFNPNLPNVQDGQGFANYMRTNFWREAIQFAKV